MTDLPDPVVAAIIAVGLLVATVVLAWLVADLRGGTVRLAALAGLGVCAAAVALTLLVGLLGGGPPWLQRLQGLTIVTGAIVYPVVGTVLLLRLLGSRWGPRHELAAVVVLGATGAVVLLPPSAGAGLGAERAVVLVAPWMAVSLLMTAAMAHLLALDTPRLDQQVLMVVGGHLVALIGGGVAPLLWPLPQGTAGVLWNGAMVVALSLWCIPAVTLDPLELPTIAPARRRGTDRPLLPPPLRGKALLVPRDRIAEVMGAAARWAQLGASVVVVTHGPPARLRAQWGLRGVPIVHLSQESFEDLVLAPDRLGQLGPVLRRALEGPSSALVVITDLYYLFANETPWTTAATIEGLVGAITDRDACVFLDGGLLAPHEERSLRGLGVVPWTGGGEEGQPGLPSAEAKVTGMDDDGTELAGAGVQRGSGVGRPIGADTLPLHAEGSALVVDQGRQP